MNTDGNGNNNNNVQGSKKEGNSLVGVSFSRLEYFFWLSLKFGSLDYKM